MNVVMCRSVAWRRLYGLCSGIARIWCDVGAQNSA